MREEEKSLFKTLADWDSVSSIFSKEEIHSIEMTVRRYLANYLPAPLKTEIFQQKLAAAF